MVERVYLAKPRGFCAGVVMAINAVERAAAELKGEGDLVVYHSIVHNDVVVERLRRRHGVHIVEDLSEIAELEKKHKLARTIVFSAHGIPPSVREEVLRMGWGYVDATCPLVTKVHSEARLYADRGYTVLLIGDSADHQEVRGTLGEAPESTILVAVHTHVGSDPRLADPRTVTVPDPEKVAVFTQTTLSVDDTDRTIEILKRRFPKLVQPSRSDLCYATKNRQDQVKLIAPHVDLFLVLTSSYSSNGMRLFEIASSLTQARRIDTAADLREEWFADARSVGITSAASTPEDLVQDVLAYLRRLNPELEVIEEGEWEQIRFREPRRVGPPLERS